MEQVRIEQEETPVPEPGAAKTVPFMVAGAVMSAAGILLAVLVHPALGLLAAAGIVLVILGLIGRTKHKKAEEAYAAYQQREAIHKEAVEKKDALFLQHAEAERSAAALQAEIDDTEKMISEGEKTVLQWLRQWQPDASAVDETVLRTFSDRVHTVRTLREQQKMLLQQQESIASLRQQQQDAMKLAEQLYPEIGGKSIPEALMLLRKQETACKIKCEQLADAEKAFADWLHTMKLTEAQLAEPAAPEYAALQEQLLLAEASLSETDLRRVDLDAEYPEIKGLDAEKAIALLQKKLGEYQVLAGQLKTAEKAVKDFLNSMHLTAEDMQQDTPPKLAALQRELSALQEQQKTLAERIASVMEAYPMLDGKSAEEGAVFLREKCSAYKAAEEQLRTCERSKQHFLKNCRYSIAELEGETAAFLMELQHKYDTLIKEAEHLTSEIAAVLSTAGIDSNAPLEQQIGQAAQMLKVYRSYAEKLADAENRQQKRIEQIEKLQKAIDSKSEVMQGMYPELALDARIVKIREDAAEALHIDEKLAEIKTALQRNTEKTETAQAALDAYLAAHTGFTAEHADILAEIDRRAEEFRSLSRTAEELEKQKQVHLADAGASSAHTENAEEQALREEIAAMEAHHDEMLMEYSQKGEQIRNADAALTQYADVRITVLKLYEKKMKMQKELATLRRAAALIKQAKENLAERYLGKVEQRFNRYMQLWLENDRMQGTLDTDFGISISEDGKTHVAEGYSTGYCDLIDFCMRLALVDTLFVQEQPFLILDDPFVNLDHERTEKILELLQIMSDSMQMIYFVCHPIRAVETETHKATREKLLQMSDAAKTRVAAEAKTVRRSVHRNPRELYTVAGEPSGVIPAEQDMRITNRIFTMALKANPQGSMKDKVYELFFIDEKGRVLGERRIVEVKNGILSMQRVQFSLNTREDSGSQFELMIHESGQDDYTVAARIPMTVKIDIGISLDDF